ncbi:MAG: class I SAM-dependent methyltransferase [Xanthomonadaceae bacterium]|nr:class I SAM-dependent methyltransferase [Xanthomonadaceae bacterium]
MLRWIPLLVLGFCLSACTEPTDAPAVSTPAQTDSDSPHGDPIEAALSHAERLAGDAAEDEWRKPAEVLRLLDARPGMKVIDYFAGGGYYTELLSRIVGPQGQVIAYNNPPYQKFAGEKPEERYGDERLPNVAQLTIAPEDLPLEPESLDAALFVNSYHDLHWRSKDGSWPDTDPEGALAKLAEAMKPGATVVVVDHVAQAESDPAVSVDALHRIDPDVIKRDFAAAGFELVTESTALRNSEDDHTLLVFDPKIRHQTDRVILKFVKR